MMAIAVCDDEIIECSNIAKRIRKILEEMQVSCIIRQFGSGLELLQAEESFDLIFLDIIMDGLNGMETAQMFRKKTLDKLLVFISSSRQYVFEAYDVEAFQYLVKPVEDKKLKSVLEKAVHKTEKHSQEFILVSKEREKKKVFLQDIYYFEIRGRKIDIHEKDCIFTYYEQIGILEDSLREKGFFRCHKSYLINLRYASAYNRQEVTMENGDKISIAKRRYEEFCNEFLKYMRKNGGII